MPMLQDVSRQEIVGDVKNPAVVEGMYKLIGAVIGEAIKPDATRRLANGRMNRPEDRGGETKEWLNSTAGQYWLNLAELTGQIDIEEIRAIADNPSKAGYDGKNKWD